MVKNKSTCGLCKPHKKWKKNNTKEKQRRISEVSEESLSLYADYNFSR